MVIPSIEIALAFVGTVVPDTKQFHNEAFSRAAQMFQENLLVGLRDSGLPPTLIISARPHSSFPKSRRIWLSGGWLELGDGLVVRLLPALNVTPIKQLLIGVGTALALLWWGWKNRRRHRVVYTYNLTVPPGLFTWLTCKAIRAKIVASICDINVPGQTVPNTLFNRFDFWLHSKLIQRLDGRVVVADAIARDFAPNLPSLRMEGAVSGRLFEVRSEPKLAEDMSHFRIVFAGSLDPVNGIRILLASFSQIAEPKFRLIIAGSGPEERLVREAAASDPRISYPGLLSFGEVWNLYESADVLVCMRPTRELKTNYFFPSKVMEYLASGTPVVTTCTGHIEEEFGKICFLLKDETAEGLRDMLLLVASLPARDRFKVGASAREYMRTQKTWAVQSRKVADFIRSLFHNTDGIATTSELQESNS